MKATVKKIDLGKKKKKKGQSGFYSVFLFIVVAGSVAYYLRDQPVMLQLRDTADRLFRPIHDLIEGMFPS